MTKRKLLYTGLNPPESLNRTYEVVHIPLIQIEPRSPIQNDVKSFFSTLSQATDLIFTSKTAVEIFTRYLPYFDVSVEQLYSIRVLSVGHATSSFLKKWGFPLLETAQNETAEGIIECLKAYSQTDLYFFWPHAAGARSVIRDFIKEKQWLLNECVLYDTLPCAPILSLEEFDSVYFSSPSTVDAFYRIMGNFPQHISYLCQGVVTEKHLKNFTFNSCQAIDS